MMEAGVRSDNFVTWSSFPTDALVSLAVSSAGGRATQPYDGRLGNSLRTLAARLSADRCLPPRWDT